ncbi:ABC transporter permease [Nitriliruptor alkaliphilus]|uniref:ABC transporter permease n=1 Tax=Nitriliruptor alkaliphilus TaxID=427918 RepID=UPI000695FFA2|nr:ABC transporter permease [Nitriliruptor alkaliphilus]
MPSTDQRDHLDDLAGIDALDTPTQKPPAGRTRHAWSILWPKLAAIAIFLGGWQIVVWSGWRPPWVLPGPLDALTRLWRWTADGTLISATSTTMTRAIIGYALALLFGAAIGLAVATIPVLRTAVGSLITGVQTMPSIAWFPLAILLFQLSERAILFVIVLGAAPAIANGLIHGIDHTPPLLNRAGRVLGATGIDRYRFVVLPAALPGFVGGLKQGWAFAWRSLMAGELLVVIAERPSLGVRLQFARELSDAEGLLATMLVILIIGVLVDALLFARLEQTVRRRWGLNPQA